MDWIVETIAEFLVYVKTDEFRKGIYVEMGGMAIDILLLLIFIPLMVWLYGIPARYRANKLASFTTLQFIRDGVVLLLKLGGCTDPRPELDKELKNGNLKVLLSHPIYGNTQNLLDLLQIRMKNGDHANQHRAIDNKLIASLRVDAVEMLGQCDRNISMFAGLRMFPCAEHFFQMRVLFLALHDYLVEMKEICGNGAVPLDEFKAISTGLGMELERWFLRERKIPDRIYKIKYFVRSCRMVAMTPLALGHAFVLAPILTRLGFPYRSPYRLEVARIILEHASSKTGREEFFAKLKMNGKQVRALLNKPDASEETLNVLLQIREVFSPQEWDTLLSGVIVSELRRLNRKKLASLAKADAAFIYSRVACKPDGVVLLRLVHWEKTYESMM